MDEQITLEINRLIEDVADRAKADGRALAANLTKIVEQSQQMMREGSHPTDIAKWARSSAATVTAQHTLRAEKAQIDQLNDRVASILGLVARVLA